MLGDKASILDKHPETEEGICSKAYNAVHLWTLMMLESTGRGR